MVTTMTVEEIRDYVSTALNDVFDNRGTKLKPIYPRFLKEFKAETAQLITEDIAYFGKVPRKDEMEPFAYESIKKGDLRVTEAAGYGLGFKLSLEAQIKLSKRPYGDFNLATLASMKTITEKMRDSELQTKEGLAAKLITSANSTTQTEDWIGAGRDGKALASLTHETKTNAVQQWANLVTGSSLSQSAVGDLIKLLYTAPSPEGFKRGIGSKLILVVGPENMHRAAEIKKTPKGLDTPNGNYNYLNEFDYDILINQHLDDFTGFALIDPSNARCGYFSPVPAQFRESEDHQTGAMLYSIYFQHIVDFLDPYGFALNPGA
jgi:hypothetical protein